MLLDKRVIFALLTFSTLLTCIIKMSEENVLKAVIFELIEHRRRHKTNLYSFINDRCVDLLEREIPFRLHFIDICLCLFNLIHMIMDRLHLVKYEILNLLVLLTDNIKIVHFKQWIQVFQRLQRYFAPILNVLDKLIPSCFN